MTRFSGRFPVLLIITVSAAVTAGAVSLLIGDKREDIGSAVRRAGITMTLRSVAETQTGTQLEIVVNGLPPDGKSGFPVDFYR